MFDQDILDLADDLGKLLMARGERVTTAESCTGGLIAGAITSVAGSSGWFHGGYVTYDDAVKCSLLGVRADTLAQEGAVSERTVREMAEGAALRMNAHWSLAVSGIAGPGGAVAGKPVGTVWFGLGRLIPPGVATTQAVVQRFEGDRARVRHASVVFTLAWLLRTIEAEPLLA